MFSTFTAILMHALELMPGRAGPVAGFFCGLTFGPARIAVALLAGLTDEFGIATVHRIRSFLPSIGLLAWLLLRLRKA
jgi:FSR family fosmidomycin resistance protein-like MFS transporter